MRVIVVANHKGGVGKTTLTGHLAVQAGLVDDKPAAVIDLDPQGSLSEWVNSRASQTPVFIDPSKHGGLVAMVQAARERGFGSLLIDTPPSKSNDLQPIIAVASIVLVPIQASPHDLRAVLSTVSLIKKARRPMVFCLNRVQPRVRMTAEAAIFLSEHGTIAPAMIGNRTDFAASMTGGLTVQESVKASPGNDEIARLWNHLVERIDEHEYQAEARSA